jgi:hypothetical protein
VKGVLLAVKIGLVAVVVVYAASPTLIDARHSGWAGLAILLLIALMAYEGLQAAKILKKGQKRDHHEDT